MENELAQIRRPAIRRLMLADFRSYVELDLTVETQLVALTGDNGAGKTNVLEALSLLTAGRGLRRADLSDMAREDGPGSFAVSAMLWDDGVETQLGVGLDLPSADAPAARRVRIDRAPVSSARAFAEHLRLVWLTPAMDGLFVGTPGDRRRFLDRLVLAVDADHGARVNALEKSLRNRNRLLEDGSRDHVWLDAAERELAELAVAVAAARQETVSRLRALIQRERNEDSPFPWAEVTLLGELETIVGDLPALEVEDRYRQILRDNRGRDAAAGRTLIGPQSADLYVKHGPKGADASRSSTGEQKALLVGLVLAHARLVAAMSGIAPMVLLDEVAAHFDPLRRAALFSDLRHIGGQVWMTGADPAAFAELDDAALLHVTPGRIDVRNP